MTSKNLSPEEIRQFWEEHKRQLAEYANRMTRASQTMPPPEPVTKEQRDAARFKLITLLIGSPDAVIKLGDYGASAPRQLVDVELQTDDVGRDHIYLVFR